VKAVRAARKALQRGARRGHQRGARKALADADGARRRGEGQAGRWCTPTSTPTSVARVVGDWTGIPVGKMQKDDVAVLLSLEERLRERVRGQDHAMQDRGRDHPHLQAGINNPNQPVGVLLFVGPSGVGKTETALALADASTAASAS
jgi:type VI secretion system protein VasG